MNKQVQQIRDYIEKQFDEVAVGDECAVYDDLLKFIDNLSNLESNGKDWSEGDEGKFRDIIGLIEQSAPVQSIRDFYTNWLKSLKDRYIWKPSDDQMEALADALSLAKNCGEERAFDLRTLYEQLQKIKENKL